MTQLIARHFWKSTLRSKSLLPIYSVWLLLVVYFSYTASINYSTQNGLVKEYQEKTRDSWEANPDKHPHRMAHFGSFAFRKKYPLSLFDSGMENFTGNAVYLEAHKQNTVNFSEAGFSTGILRFGELNLSVLLQVVLPLILFFLGFPALASQRENGTLKILLGQGASFKSLILGNSLGLFGISLLFLFPVLISSTLLLSIHPSLDIKSSILLRGSLLLLAYLMFLWVISSLSICISAASANGRSALLSSLGLWLLLTIVVPKTLQAIGSYSHPAPGKLEFESLVEKEILQQGDSHNPDDIHYKKLKDSVLQANNVDSIQQLSFNYSGFQMMVGEKTSAEVYAQHLIKLFEIYTMQNRISYYAAAVNPVISIKNLSMALSGTDFEAYQYFQHQAEEYRYKLAQTMNELQMKFISNRRPGIGDKPQIIERSHWHDFPDFEHHFMPVKTVLGRQLFVLLSITGWVLASWLIIVFTARTSKAI